jgi:hypothetical protein
MRSLMRISATTAALGAAVVLSTSANAAVVLCSSGPGIDLTVDQCTASGNDDLASVEAAISAATGVNTSLLELSLYGKSDDNPSLFFFSPSADPTASNIINWTVLDGTLIKYVTVTAANAFKVYELPGAGSSTGVDFSTLGILNGGNNQPDISHLSFWSVPASSVPEPATWGLMLMGLGLVGAAMRRGASQVGYRVA